MEVSRHWRLIKDRYHLRGEKRVLPDGTELVKLNGHTSWFELQTNGHHKEEDPFQGEIIYQAPPETEVIGQQPLLVRGEVEISVSDD